MAVINGKKEEIRKGCTIQELLKQRGCRLDRVAVERNGDIVPKKEYPNTEILPEDTLEIVTFVGGG